MKAFKKKMQKYVQTIQKLKDDAKKELFSEEKIEEISGFEDARTDTATGRAKMKRTAIDSKFKQKYSSEVEKLKTSMSKKVSPELVQKQVDDLIMKAVDEPEIAKAGSAELEKVIANTIGTNFDRVLGIANMLVKFSDEIINTLQSKASELNAAKPKQAPVAGFEFMSPSERGAQSGRRRAKAFGGAGSRPKGAAYMFESRIKLMVLEELTKTDAKKIAKDEAERVALRVFKDEFESQLSKALKKKTIKDELSGLSKDVIKKIYRELSFNYPAIIDRIKN